MLLPRQSRWSLVLVLFVCCAARAQHVATTDPLPAAEERNKFHLPAGFEIELFAAEPQIHKPVNFAFDARGRLWVSETVEYPSPAKPGKKPRDAIKVLEDTDGDGRADRVTTFASGLNIPLGVLPVSDGAVVFSIPTVSRYRDTDGDLRADEHTELFAKFGSDDTHGMLNSFTYGLDGWAYACHGFGNTSVVKTADGQQVKLHSGNTVRFRPDGSRFEYFTHGQVNPFGLTLDPWGDLYSADCHTLPIYLLLRGAYYPSFGKAHDGLGFGPTMLSHNHGSSGIGGIAYYAAEQFPPAYRDTIFVGNPVTGRINHDRLEHHGSTPRAIELPDFISSDDPWFRPVYLQVGPDGALYIADFYNRIIAHYEVPLDHPGRDRERGRIWRVVYRGDKAGASGGAAPRPSKAPDMHTASLGQLVALLGDANLAVRTLATHEVFDRFGQRARPELLAAIERRESPRWQKAHALWLLERLGGLSDKSVERLSSDAAIQVRVHLVKALAERDKWTPRIAQLVREMLADSDGRVQRAAADALARHPDAANIRPLVHLIGAAPAADTHLVHVARMALRDQLASVKTWTTETYPPDEAARLADACLGLATPEAADFLWCELQTGHGLRPLDALVHHIARNIRAEELDRVCEFVFTMRVASLEERSNLLRSLARAQLERGLPPSAKLEAQVAAAVCELLASKREPLVRLGIDVARELRPSVFEELSRAAASGAPFAALRGAAVEACVAVDPLRAAALLGSILGNAAEPMNLRQLAASTLGKSGTDAARQTLATELAAAPDQLATVIATGLAETDAGAEILLTNVEQGKASRRLLVDRGIKARLAARHGRDLSVRLAQLVAGLPPEDERIRKLLANRRKLVLAGHGDAERGRIAFQKHCGICHRVGQQGAKIGPNLDGIGIRGVDRLLEDVFDPNRNVDQAFRTTRIATSDGRIVSGLVLREEGQVVVLADQEGKEIRLEREDIEEREVSPLSPMPANVADLLGERELPHLVAYLLSLRAAARAPD